MKTTTEAWLREAASKGMTHVDIAIELGITLSEVGSAMRVLGIKRSEISAAKKEVELRSVVDRMINGEPLGVVASSFGISLQAMRIRLLRAGLPTSRVAAMSAALKENGK